MKTSTLAIGPGALADYYDWFGAAREGDVLEYWRGDLQFDRDPLNFPADMTDEARAQCLSLNSVAHCIRRDAASGSLILTQKRHGPNDYTYRAQRKATKSEAAANLIPGLRRGTLCPA